MWRAKRALSICAVVVAAVALSGCGQWYGTVRFQHQWDGGGLGGGSRGNEITTYTVDPGSALARVTVRTDTWGWDVDGKPMPNGCKAINFRYRGSATAAGYVNVAPASGSQPPKLFAGLVPATADTTYPVDVVESYDRDGNSCGSFPAFERFSFATRGATNPELLVGAGPFGPGSPDGGYVSWQEDCPPEPGSFESCLVVFDLHPQSLAPPSVK